MLETRPSPSVCITSPEGRNVQPSTRLRGLSKLRSRLQSSSQSSPDASRISPRHYFGRSISCSERRPGAEAQACLRSSSRPDESRHQHESLVTTQSRRTRSASRSRSRDREPTAPASIMARRRSLHSALGISEPSRTQHLRARPTTSGENATNGSEHPHRTRSASGVDRGVVVAGDTPEPGESHKLTHHQLPTIRLLPHQEIRNGRPSLPFAPIARTLPSESSIIRVGRYSEREGIPIANPPGPSDAPVGFKSKVVSRRHCEFSFSNGQWQIKDVCSSSGTFLNHIRLSQPNMESKLFPIKDGDIIQLGIDFRGGEEMIFRCVKIRVECNRGWQKKPNNYNMTRHAQLQSLGKSEASTENNGECAICLCAVLPCQSLFVAACAHVWHYRCIRPMLEGKNSTYPHFQCPNCRAWADLETEVDVVEQDMDEWVEKAEDLRQSTANADIEMAVSDTNEHPDENVTDLEANADSVNQPPPEVPATRDVAEETLMNGHVPSTSGLLARRQASNPTSPALGSLSSFEMSDPLAHTTTNVTQVSRLSGSPPDRGDVVVGEGPLTPRNNAGPFVFDGSAGRGNDQRVSSE